MAWSDLFLLLAIVGSGLVAGLCFAFASFILQAFDQLDAPEAIRAMQAINQRILRSAAMAVWMGTVVIGVIAVILAEKKIVAGTSTALYALAALLITGRGNVPLNEELDRVDPAAPGADEAWRRYRVLWGRWNAVRTVLCALASAGFAGAL